MLQVMIESLYIISDTSNARPATARVDDLTCILMKTLDLFLLQCDKETAILILDSHGTFSFLPFTIMVTLAQETQ